MPMLLAISSKSVEKKEEVVAVATRVAPAASATTEGFALKKKQIHNQQKVRYMT